MNKQFYEINSEEELEKIIKTNKGVLIVDFSSPVCPPCLMLEPILEQLVKENICSVAKINVFEQQELAAKNKVNSTPTILLIKDSEVKHKVIGYQPIEEWKKIIDKM
ncbi:MAG: thioredoxin fold domain-containing protein [Mycoplasmataceae bacterium]|nr:thioredoxin fold domain-containing protein [Mycoplasmataceae bacterium]MBR2055641.1 thioredoxin fold domain-containing protein [Mycoplasmataceae bacterium]MBR2849315.1 thioredoxin fold domain-containing protein [Mycoplasmataceae bacterium]MBR2999312.1 thioredoxin fold domain-containing protein [Mycoplasmataceae bacterium]MBR4025911.1 thioredoxin fold domain-containing protein [Mycoplasmataceae bacterium]